MKKLDNGKPPSGKIQMDDVYWGDEQHGGSAGEMRREKHHSWELSRAMKMGILSLCFTKLKKFLKKKIAQWAQRLGINNSPLSLLSGKVFLSLLSPIQA